MGSPGRLEAWAAEAVRRAPTHGLVTIPALVHDLVPSIAIRDVFDAVVANQWVAVIDEARLVVMLTAAGRARRAGR